ncbi:tellurite resistance/C4-dicarboxylate transporter family protein [Specibacter cremeus]|uniref:tellurite resistance/C4-dicarboxylate transporter family protein n=1 Tax=Specibacter cremeus TaxID=1629051 RepID=UPI000F776877|nr:tellurite resistance/C4-dicarboxylate transporter family protein [Specibacter cremeus]
MTGPAPRRWWLEQPPAAFSFVMATGIVSTALLDVGARTASTALRWVAAAALVVLAAGLLARLVTRTAPVVADFRSPHVGFGYLTLVAALNVVGTGFHATDPAATWLLAAVSVPVWLFLAYGVPLSMMLRTDAGASRRALLLPVDGSWFLWVVSTQSLSIAAATLAADDHTHPLLNDAAVALWGIGIMLYLTLTTLVILRLLTGADRGEGIVPSNWIFMGATAITVLAGSLILGLPAGAAVVKLAAPVVGGVSYLLWAFGLWWVPLLVAFGFWRHAIRREPLRYGTALWSIVFPLGMFAAATFRFGRGTGLPVLASIGQWTTWVAVVVWAAVTAGMLATAATALARRRNARRTQL